MDDGRARDSASNARARKLSNFGYIIGGLGTLWIISVIAYSLAVGVTNGVARDPFTGGAVSAESNTASATP